MSQAQKLCPKCRSRADLAATFCPACGHQFRTQFAPPPDRTIMVPPDQPAYSPPPAYHPTAPVGGPLDTTERSVSMAWTVVGLVLAGLFLISGLRTSVNFFAAQSSELGFGSLLITLGIGFAFSFLLMRFRRLYISTPGEIAPDEWARRRSLFALSGSGVVLLVLTLGCGWGLFDVQQAAQARAKLEQERVRREAQREEEMRARRLQQAELEVQREETRRIEAENLRRSIQTYQSPAPAPLPSQTFRPLDAPTVHRSAPRRPRIRTAPSVQMSTPGRPADPNLMPCGHRFVEFLNTGGFGGPSYVARCVQGHRYRLRDGRWAAERF